MDHEMHFVRQQLHARQLFRYGTKFTEREDRILIQMRMLELKEENALMAIHIKLLETQCHIEMWEKKGGKVPKSQVDRARDILLSYKAACEDLKSKVEAITAQIKINLMFDRHAEPSIIDNIEPPPFPELQSVLFKGYLA